MIFVTLGTQDKTFERLLKWCESIESDEEIICQVGNTKFTTEDKRFKIYDFLTQKEFSNYLKKARVVITHAGVGTIIEGLKLNKKMIVVARLKEYNEHVNDHQLQILENFASNGYILACSSKEELNSLIEKDFEPKEFKSNNQYFNKRLDEKIEELMRKK